MADESDILLREVDDDLRRERYAKLWDKYGVIVMAGAFLIIAGVAGGKFWQYWSAKQAAQSGEKYIAALDLSRDNKFDDAAKVLDEFSKNGPTGYSVLARFRLAVQIAKSGDTAAAVEAYDKLAQDRSVATAMQGYAMVRSAVLLLDTASSAEIETRLKDLIKDENPWRGTARELIGLSAYKAGEHEKARDQFSAILSGAGTTPGLRQRAEMMLGLLLSAEIPGNSDKKPEKSETPKP